MRKNNFQKNWILILSILKLTSSLQTTLFSTGYFLFWVTGGKEITLRAWLVFKTVPLVAWGIFYSNLGWTLIWNSTAVITLITNYVIFDITHIHRKVLWYKRCIFCGKIPCFPKVVLDAKLRKIDSFLCGMYVVCRESSIQAR